LLSARHWTVRRLRWRQAKRALFKVYASRAGSCSRRCLKDFATLVAKATGHWLLIALSQCGLLVRRNELIMADRNAHCAT
jgi:hypothetical protein